MGKNDITWEKFLKLQSNPQGIRMQFEDLCRQLFMNEFLGENKTKHYLHSNPNNAGLETDPIYDENSHRWIGFQAKYFDVSPDYAQIEHSAKKIVEYYNGQVEHVYLFCNKPLKTTAKGYERCREILSSAGITLELVTNNSILDLVRRYPYLGSYYFGAHTLDREWFECHAERMFGELGDRFHRKFHVDTRTSLNLSLFLHDSDAVGYYNEKKRELIREIDSLGYRFEKYGSFKKNLREAILALDDISEDSIVDVKEWKDQVMGSISGIMDTLVKEKERKSEILHDKYEIAYGEKQYAPLKDADPNSINRSKDREAALKEYHSLMREIDDLDLLLSLPERLDVNDIEQQLLTEKILIIRGNAGTGKSQMLAHETEQLLEQGRTGLLLLGGDFWSEEPIEMQIMQRLSLCDISFGTLIDILEVMGERQNRIVPVLIDALNESWSTKAWKLSINRMFEKVRECSYVKLVVSYRPEYEKNLFPQNLTEALKKHELLSITHHGFADNSMEAARQFFDYYGIPFSALDYFGYEMENPLFLTLYCRTYRGDEVDLPTLYERILEHANANIHISMADALKNSGYSGTEDLLTPFIEELSEYMFDHEQRTVTQKEMLKLHFWRDYRIAGPAFIGQLSKEQIIHDIDYGDEKNLYFSYDQMNDYYFAKSIFFKIETKDEITGYLKEKVLGIYNGRMTHFENVDLFVNACALYADKYREECIDIIDDLADEQDRAIIFEKYVESFQWRKRSGISRNSLIECLNKYSVSKDTVWHMFIGNSIKEKHPLNADFLHEFLMHYDMCRRDYMWTAYINGLTVGGNDRLMQLISMYNSGEELDVGDGRKIELLLTLFSWVLTSSNRWLRDTVSKAMVEILKKHFYLCKELLEKFKDVNDPYVIQRLYGIVFGACCKRTEKSDDIYSGLAEYVYETVFNQEKVYPDILLRDYVRLIIERFLWEHPGYTGGIDREVIRPPYLSDPIPATGYTDHSGDDKGYGTYSVISSMRFEGMGMYGDFGRYVFQSALHDFEVDKKNIHDYALAFIFDELGYDEDILGEIERNAGRGYYSRHDTAKLERIGKKYEWIAFYNIMARVTDNCRMTDRYGDDNDLRYEGAWEPYVRDFDPTLNNHFLKCPDAPNFVSIDKHIAEIKHRNSDASVSTKESRKEWLSSFDEYFNYLKEDMILTGDEGIQWIMLTRYADSGFEEMKVNHLYIWSWSYAFFVTEEQASALIELSSDKADFYKMECNGLNEVYAIYDREYPWSPACKTIREYAWREMEVPTGKTEPMACKKGSSDMEAYESLLKRLGYADLEIENYKPYRMETCEKEITQTLGEVLCATSDLLWEEEYDASKNEAISRRVPCAELIEDMELSEQEYDGFYYDKYGKIAAFDIALNGQKGGCVVRKDILDEFLERRSMRLAWIIRASKEIHVEDLSIAEYSDWSSALVYDGMQANGDIYRAETR